MLYRSYRLQKRWRHLNFRFYRFINNEERINDLDDDFGSARTLNFRELRRRFKRW